MSSESETAATRGSCACVRKHVPKVSVPDVHHIQPRAWGGLDVPENRVVVCPTTHRNIHELLGHYVVLQAIPPLSLLMTFPPYARRLAWEAIDRHGGIPPRERGSGA